MKVNQHLQMSITTCALMLTLGACSQPLSGREKGALVGGGAGRLAAHLLVA